MNPPYYWPHLTREEIVVLLQQGVVTAILPFGSTEQHGPHLMTGNDYLFAERLALDLGKSFNAFVLPPIPYGMADHHMGFKGTITVKESTLIALIEDVAKSIEKTGIQNLVISNGHGGNYSLISKFADSWKGSLKIFHDAKERQLFYTGTPFLNEFSAAVMGTHAGLQETSIAMHTHPEFGVRKNRLELGAMPATEEWTAEEMKTIVTQGLHAITKNGILGDARGSSPELGKRFYDSLVEMYIQFYKQKGLDFKPQ